MSDEIQATLLALQPKIIIIIIKKDSLKHLTIKSMFKIFVIAIVPFLARNF